MDFLRIHLLGEFSLVYGNRFVTTVNTARLQSLLAYLVLHRNASTLRSHLAYQFWPDSSESQARTNLRHLMHLLRQALPHTDEFLMTDGALLQWRADAPYTLDVAQFEDALAAGALREAVDLYRGDLLPGCYDDWVIPERERLHNRVLDASERLIEQLGDRQEHRTALTYAQWVLRLDPLHEGMHRRLMSLHALNADRIGVVRAYGTCVTLLRRELDVEPSDETRAAYAVCLERAGAQHITPGDLQLDYPDTCGGNLPLQLTSIIGRRRETEEIKRLMAARRLVTLTGTGGVGKTRLALAVAGELSGAYSGGTWHVDLASLSDPALVVQAIAATMGIRGEMGYPLLAGVIEHVRSIHMLLLLDNCEHLVEAVRSVVQALLGAAPHLRILATSRVVLSVAGETAWPVPPLPVPELSPWIEPAGPGASLKLRRCESVQLFVERATAALPTFKLTDDNAWAVGRLCRHLDGVPLALELAAARVKLLTVQEIAERLEDGLGLLTQGSPMAVPHQQTMMATMEWSHALLTPEEQMLFRRLSVFAGGATPEAIEVICCGEGVSAAFILDLLSSMVDKSLLSVDLSGEASRVRLHEVARQYARAKLAEAGEEARLRNRHLAYFCRLTEALEPHLLDAMSAAAARQMLSERDNLCTALTWSMTEGADAQCGLRLAAALPTYWELRGPTVSDRDALLTLLATVGATAGQAVRAKALRGAGQVAYYQCDFQAAGLFFEQSLILDRELDNRAIVAETLSRLGFLHSVQEDFPAAERLLRESLAMCRTLGDRRVEAQVLSELGYTAFRQGEWVVARQVLEHSLTLNRDLGDRYTEARTRHFLGHLARYEGDHASAHTLYSECLATVAALSNAWGVFYSLLGFGYVATARGQFERAARLFGAAERLQGLIGTSMVPSERAEYERDAAHVRTVLKEPASAEAWAKGRAMAQDEAILYALEPLCPTVL